MEETISQLLTPQQVAKKLNLNVRTVSRLTKEGIIPGHKLSKKIYRYKAEDIEKALQTQVVKKEVLSGQ